MCRAVAEKGYAQPTPIQIESIPAILKGRDVFGGAQTGTGKTACFTLPLLQINAEKAKGKKRVTRALVLVPTRELAAQVSDNVRAYGKHLHLRSVIVAGGFPIRMQIREVERGVDIIIATPGRLLDLLKRKRVSLKNLNTLVLDEADRMLDMGFMPDIRRILEHVPDERQSLMFAATSTKLIEKLAQTILRKPLRIQVGSKNQTPDKVSHIVYFVGRQDKPAALAKLYKDNSWGQVLVFTRTKADADMLKEKLMEQRLTASVIHGGKQQAIRTKTLKRFKTGVVKILIATDVAARGLDIDLLPLVINFELPQSPDDYIHRIGRTGRAGNEGCAIALVSKSERHSLSRIERQLKKIFKREKLEGFEETWAPGSELGKRRPDSRSKKFDPFKGRVVRDRPTEKPKKKDRWGKKSDPFKTIRKDSSKSGHPPKKKTGFEKFYGKRKRKKQR